MKIKQWLYLAGAGLLTLVAAACGNKAPELWGDFGSLQ